MEELRIHTCKSCGVLLPTGQYCYCKRNYVPDTLLKNLTSPINLHGFSLDKPIEDFYSLVSVLIEENQDGRSDQVRYLIERCRIAEAQIEILKEQLAKNT